MRSIIFRTIACMAVMLVLAGNADAKWWIFGKSQENVGLDYLYINNVAFNEKDTKITIYKESLSDGNLIIRGKAITGKNQTGSVQISLDGKEKWEKAKLSNNGAFEYVFKPTVGQDYELYVKAIDTTGKTNEVDATHKTVSVSGESVAASVKQILDNLVDAYKNENSRKFMSYVSESFAGDDVVLERAIRKDFAALDNIDLRFTISSTATGGEGNIYVALLYNRYVTAAKTGKPLSDKGTTEFVFKVESDGLKLFSMKNPLIFGLSDAANVATGNVINATNEEILVIAPNGDVQKLPFEQAIKVNEGGAAGAAGAPVITSITGTKHHMIMLHIDLNVDDPDKYDITLEESESPNGPWENAGAGPAVSTLSITTNAIASQAKLLYYRVQLTECLGEGKTSEWSNVAVWDNI